MSEDSKYLIIFFAVFCATIIAPTWWQAGLGMIMCVAVMGCYKDKFMGEKS